MKFAAPLLSAALLAQSASAHYIWTTLIAGSTTSTAAVRQPLNNSPVTSVTSNDIRCNVNPSPASQTVSVAAGSTIGFKLDNTLYHQGPAAIYLGKAPSTAASWDGSGANWFKANLFIAEWGATFNPFTFTDFNANQLTTTIPSSVPAGEYLVRIEAIGLHVAGAPQWYISCAQISITGGGSANPAKVSIPGYVSPSDPGLTVNIYNPVPTSYTNRSYRDISTFNYASPTIVPPPSAIPTISSLDSDCSTPTLRVNSFSIGSGNSDRDDASVYSQDSGCVILDLEPKSRRVDAATPKTALTFAAIWDPDSRGFTTISGSELLGNKASVYGKDGEYEDDFDFYGGGHPDCDPHLPSRFSVTTTSTSNYVDVDFAEDEGDTSTWSGGKLVATKGTSEYLRPGDYHPPWIPQIFNVGYTKPKPPPISTPKRPEISEPFQLTGSAGFPRKQNPFLHGSPIQQARPPLPSRKGSDDTIVPSELQLNARIPTKSSDSSSPTELKRTRLPSVFSKIKRSTTNTKTPPPKTETPSERGWVVVDRTTRTRSIHEL
ncbi:hypothetical protein V5O48_010647 [Marasmius crinis-equi]|uniref:AA9 family lytic polysaccharide monooxygenase n=1 Tax=Marasmius crinis-equi TaxID=585013 RepID=A0ABR3F825_9AGAR